MSRWVRMCCETLSLQLANGCERGTSNTLVIWRRRYWKLTTMSLRISSFRNSCLLTSKRWRRRQCRLCNGATILNWLPSCALLWASWILSCDSWLLCTRSVLRVMVLAILECWPFMALEMSWSLRERAQIHAQPSDRALRSPNSHENWDHGQIQLIIFW